MEVYLTKAKSIENLASNPGSHENLGPGYISVCCSAWCEAAHALQVKDPAEHDAYLTVEAGDEY